MRGTRPWVGVALAAILLGVGGWTEGMDVRHEPTAGGEQLHIGEHEEEAQRALLPPPLAAGPIPAGVRAAVHGPGGSPVVDEGAAADAPTSELYRTGVRAWEPTLGITQQGSIFYPGWSPNAVVRSADDGHTWEDVSPRHVVSNDPYLYVDPETSRVFRLDLMALACSYVSFTDDGGSTWLTNPWACGKPVNDHPTLAAGPAVTSPTIGYPNAVYVCWNDLGAENTCAKSLDGGLSFVHTGRAAYGGTCAGPSGHVFVGPDGTVYLPKACQNGFPTLAMSRDEGQSWRRVRVADLGPAVDGRGIEDHEAGVVADANGNVYFVWVAEDRLPYLAVSRDGGSSWSRPMMVAPPGVNETTLPGIAVGGAGKIAIVYVGTETSPGKPFPPYSAFCSGSPPCEEPAEYADTTWNGYITMTTTALDPDPVFFSAAVNPPDDPIKRGTCGPQRCRSVGDFLDIVIAPDGTPWAAFVDGCRAPCLGPGPQWWSADGLVGRLVGGPSLH